MDSTIGTALSSLLGMIIALAVVLGLAWISLRALRRWQDRGLGGRENGAERQLRFVRALPVGQRERLVLIEAEGELMLIGVSGGAISLLRNWGAPEAEIAVPPAPEPAR
ncbi:flagellar protein FliO/FliZ [Sphingomonas naasensis]|uniref:Flagellar biosynthetic protein FliO n=1 Tax=Sphingomonas naasensis TaxID=1344951 RepID=A0A4S1WCX3_9SPHN|nr:flagellar biosynthetic protein FliO [Sphingomonas naasensis]NIJ22181.1 flagellar protein FliO/FliZ [Sphingomonas naasensis]TGX40798.1 flagellar biosynthetic protein FliO [Sphingomonas naasensis]